MKFPRTLKLSVLPGVGVTELEWRNTSQGSALQISGETESELVRLLSVVLKFKYQLLVPADREWGRHLEDGKWSGMVGMVHRNEADIAISEVGVTDERLKEVDFTFPYNFERVTFATKSADFKSVPTTLLDPFAPDIWLAIALSLVFVYVIARYVVVVGSSLQQILLKMVGDLLRAGSAFSFKAPSQGILLLSWGVGAMLVSYCYTSSLLSLLIFPLKQMNIDTKEQLVHALKSKQLICVTVKSSSVFGTILESLGESVQYMSELIVQNKWFKPFTKRDIELAISEGNVAYIGLHQKLKG